MTALEAVQFPDRPARPRPSGDALEAVRIVVLLQAATLVLATLETAIWLLAFGPIVAPSLAITAASAALTFATARGLGRRSRWACRVTLIAESLICAGGVVDTILALVLAGSFPPLTVVLTRITAPILVLALLRGQAARSATAASAVASPS